MINKKSNNLEMIGIAIGIIFIIVFVFGFVTITNKVTPVINNAFCSMSVNMRDSINQFFMGGFFKHKLGDFSEKTFGTKNPIALLCNTNKIITHDNDVEKIISDEFLRCYENMGKGVKTGVYPKENFVCSTIYFDAPTKYDKKDEEKNTVDLMKVYQYIHESKVFDSVNDFDKQGLDYENNVRFCVNAFYQQNILRNVYNSDNDMYMYISYFDDDNIMKGKFDIQQLSDDEKNDLIAGFKSTCLSLREAAVNDWMFNLSSASKNNLPSNEPFCKGMCDLFKDEEDEDLNSQALIDKGQIASGVGMYSFINSTKVSRSTMRENIIGGTIVAGAMVGSSVIFLSMAAGALAFGPAGWITAAGALAIAGINYWWEYKKCVNSCSDIQYPFDESDDVIDPDMFMFCNDMCSRGCEEINSNLNMYYNCKGNCTINCLASYTRSDCAFDTKLKGRLKKNDLIIINFNNNVKDYSLQQNNYYIHSNEEIFSEGVRGKGLILKKNDYLNISNIDVNSDFSISLWLNLSKDNNGDDLNIVGFYDNNNFVRELSWNYTSKNLLFKDYIIPGSSNLIELNGQELGIKQQSLNKKINYSELNHLVITKNNKSIKIYVNNIRVAKVNLLDQTLNKKELIIGKDINGMIDELSVYDIELDENQIKELYKNKRAIFYEEFNNEKRTIVEYPFYSSEYSIWGDYKINSEEDSYNFNNNHLSLNNNIIDLGTSNKINNGFSISFWVNPKSSSNSYLFVPNKDKTIGLTLNENLIIYVNNEDIISPIYTNNGNFKNNWHHIVLAFNNKLLKIYIDNNNVYNINYDFNDFSFSNILGGKEDNYFIGDIKDLSMYNTQITSTEVEYLYNLGQTHYLEYDYGYIPKDMRFNFTNELSNLFGTRPTNENEFSSGTKLGRGTFIIKYYDFSEWSQIKKINTFYVSQDSYSNIIYKGAIEDKGKRDYFTIEYYPYIPFDVKHKVSIE